MLEARLGLKAACKPIYVNAIKAAGGAWLEARWVRWMKVRLSVDGREVPLNPFVTRLIGNLVEALLSSLHGVEEDWRVAELRVERVG
jgi:hypothetical protein